MTVTAKLESRIHKSDGETWEEKRERLDAEWAPLVDEKRRKVHGYAHIEETPTHVLKHVLDAKPFGVRIIATRDGVSFGASPRTTRYATREEALAYARTALVQQGKRYAKKYGGAA